MVKNKQRYTDREEIIMIALALLFCAFVLLFSIYAYNRVMEIGKEIGICKDNGYDGAKFTSQWNTEIECSNYTESERLGVK